MTIRTDISPSLSDLSAPELVSFLQSLDEPDYRARQIRQALYKRLVTSSDELRELPAGLRASLAERFSIFPAETALEQTSADGSTSKTLLKPRRRRADRNGAHAL